MLRFNAIELRILVRVTTRDYPYESMIYVGAILVQTLGQDIAQPIQNIIFEHADFGR
ncbi:hypothetical protein QUF82_07535 [Thiotrichales bacterium HSG14]|nr:hypothetical protein [Thiotrichales bacterium HSG14]